MDNSVPASLAWIPPKLSGTEVAALAARWKGMEPYTAMRSAPFGRTAQDRIDLRFLPLYESDRKGSPKLLRAQFRDCDLTGANLNWTTAEHSFFENCIFDRAIMTEFTDKGSSFTACTFVGSDLRYGQLGGDWNNSKPGEYVSTYRDCLFQEVKLAKLLVGDPTFLNCRFVFKRLKSVQWDCAGFWGCRFEGAFEDLQFRGGFLPGNTADRKGRPPRAGLHATSFRDAKLRWIDIRDCCPIEKLEMPADGDAFIAEGRRIVAERDRILAACPDEVTRRLATVYLKVIRSSKEHEPKSIISRYDLFEPDDPEDEDAATWLYKHLRESYRVT